MYVSLYSVMRFYGGPEEGGWWYDTSKFVRVISFQEVDEKAYAECRRLNKMADKKRQEEGRSQGRSSVAGGADDVYLTEETFEEHDNTKAPTPHYE